MHLELFFQFLIGVELKTPHHDSFPCFSQLLLSQMLVTMDDLHHHLTMVLEQFCFNLELEDHGSHLLLDDLVVDD